jgi:hypothetical protein
MLHLRAGRRRLAGRLAHAASTVFEEHGLALRRAQAQLVEARAALDAGDAGRARSLARQARRAVRGLRVPWLEYQWHHLGARVHEAAGHRGPALTAYRRAMAALERVRSGLQVDERKIGLLADKLEVFEDAVRAALGGEQPRFDLAFEFIEQAKSRVLLDALRARAGRSRDRRPTRAERLEREILGLYNTVNATGRSDRREAGVARRAMVRRVARLERELDRLEARRSRSPASGPGGLRLATLARSLDPDQTLIEFFGQRDRIGALVVRRDGVEHHASVVTLEAAQTMLDRLRLLVGKSPAPAGVNGDRERLLLEATGEILEQLGASLTPLLPAPSSLPPSADQAPRPPARLLFIPHGPLHYLPLHAASRDGVPLAETFEIAYAPSAAIWCMASPHAASRRASTAPLPRYDVDRWSRPGDGADVLLVGPIDDRLPGAMAEIELLHARHPAARVLTREAATRDAVIEALGACRLVHVATHCMLHPERPELSGLELADGWLRVPDLAALDLDVDLVTLSACATGPGRVRSGDEMSGLLRGFLMAGARQVLASLWPVRDAETTAFMGHLAAELAAERAPSRETRRKRGAGTDDRHAIRRAVGTAVRSATLAMRRQYPHPSLWAPFVLYERRDPRLRVHAATC